MKKIHLFTIFFGIILIVIISLLPSYKKEKISTAPTTKPAVLTDETIIQSELEKLNDEQVKKIIYLDSLSRTYINDSEKIASYNLLTTYCIDSLHSNLLYYLFKFKATYLENSEKNLNFASQQMIDNLLFIENSELQTWFATKTKVLLEKIVAINPSNDSAQINLAVCDLFGNLTNNPMNSISALKKIVENNPKNSYGQYILGLASKKSGQHSKAIERFNIVLKLDKSNIDAMLNLAECYELEKNLDSAIIIYDLVKKNIKIKEAIVEIDKRIIELKKNKLK